MASAALIAVLIVLIVMTLVSVEVTMYIVHRRRRRRGCIQGVHHEKSTPWSTLGIASTLRSVVLNITEVPQPPSPSHNRPRRPNQDAYQQLDRPLVSAGITVLNPYTPPPLPPALPRLPLPAPLVMTWPNEKERLEFTSLGPVTRPPSYSQVDTSPLSPRYTLVMRGQWPSPISPTSPPPVPPIPDIRLTSPSDAQLDVPSSPTTTSITPPGAANSV